jgi:hypothetical protein
MGNCFLGKKQPTTILTPPSPKNKEIKLLLLGSGESGKSKNNFQLTFSFKVLSSNK